MDFLKKITMVALCGLNIAFGTSKNDIHIAYVCDEKYPMPMCVTMASIIDKAEANENLHFHVIDLGIKQIDKDRIKALQKYKPFELEFINLDKGTVAGFQSYCWSPAIYAKLLLANLLPTVDKCILMDADMIAAQSLSKLYNLDLKDNYVAIMNNFSFMNHHYFEWLERVNAGTILLNLQLIRKDSMPEKFMTCLKKGQQNLHKIAMRSGITKTFTEEHTFQEVCSGRILYLPPRFNFLNYMIYTDYKGSIPQALKDANADDPQTLFILNELESVVIYHYSDMPKLWWSSEGDWYYKKHSKYMRDLWYHYYAKTEYAGKSM